MCGRFEYAVHTNLIEMKRIHASLCDQYGNDIDYLYQTGEIHPTDLVPILTLGGDKPTLQIMHWGFPKWDGKGVIINARSETAGEKQMFADALTHRRCVVITTGFYEWQKRDESKTKDKFHFTANPEKPLYLAGIHNQFKIGEETRSCFVILTQEANSSMADIHDRMPVILYKNELISWLTDDSYTSTIFGRVDALLERRQCQKDQEKVADLFEIMT